MPNLMFYVIHFRWSPSPSVMAPHTQPANWSYIVEPPPLMFIPSLLPELLNVLWISQKTEQNVTCLTPPSLFDCDSFPHSFTPLLVYPLPQNPHIPNPFSILCMFYTNLLCLLYVKFTNKLEYIKNYFKYKVGSYTFITGKILYI